MSTQLFRYPNIAYERRYQPGPFINYRSYNKYLQYEFDRVCVYCRQPDTEVPNLNFGIDHYRPQKHFPHLGNDYDNLYYCCGACNSVKNQYWPVGGAKDEMIPNPCEFVMSDHLRFDKASCKVLTKSPQGIFTEKLLGLNDKTRIRYRKSALLKVKLLEKEIADLEDDLMLLEQSLMGNIVSIDQYNLEKEEIQKDIDQARLTISEVDGSLPLKAPRRWRKKLAATAASS